MTTKPTIDEQCSHLTIRHAKNWHNETDWTDSWWCTDHACDQRFVPIGYVEDAIRERDARVRELESRTAALVEAAEDAIEWLGVGDDGARRAGARLRRAVAAFCGGGGDGTKEG